MYGDQRGEGGLEVFAAGGAFLEDTCPAENQSSTTASFPRLFHSLLVILEK